MVGLKSSAKVSSPTFTLSRVYKGYISPDSSHLDAVQGTSEERASRTDGTKSERKSVSDTAMRQKPAGAASLAGGQGKAMREVWAHHYDFYRLKDSGILAEQLAESVGDSKTITVVEWGGVVKNVLPAERLVIEFAPTALSPDERQITINYPESLAGVIEKLENDWNQK